MIRAKGGRAKLESVEALYFHKRHTYWSWEAFRMLAYDVRSLYLLPDFLWGRTEQAPFGVSAVTFDPSSGSMTRMEAGWKMARREPRTDRIPFQLTQAEFLLESRWWRPKVLACFEETYDGVASRVVRVTAEGIEFEYFLQNGSDLPWMVRHKRGKSEYIRGLFDYKDVNGIMMPATYRVVDKNSENGKVFSNYKLKVQYEINPQYDPRVRKWVPTVVGDPEPWRKKHGK